MPPITALFAQYQHDCLTIFADSIRECHRLGASKWGLTVRSPNHFRLCLGSLIVATLEQGCTWFAIAPPSPSEQARLDSLPNWSSTRSGYKHPPSFSGYYWPMNTHPDLWPFLQKLHFRYLGQVAHTYRRLRLSSQRVHSDLTLAELESTLSLTLPRPDYRLP